MVTFKEVTAETDERPSEESEGAREPGSNTHNSTEVFTQSAPEAAKNATKAFESR